MTTEITLRPVGAELTEQVMNESKDLFASLALEGDSESLSAAKAQIEAQQLLRKRMGAMDEVRKWFELALFAEAELGGLYAAKIIEPPSVREGLAATQLYYAKIRGQLEAIVRRCEPVRAAILREIHSTGVFLVPRGCLKSAFDSQTDFVTPNDLANHLGVGSEQVRTLVGRNGRTTGRDVKAATVRFDIAAQVARALGVEPTTLPTATRGMGGRKKTFRRNAINRMTGGRAAKTGTGWDVALEHFRKLAQALDGLNAFDDDKTYAAMNQVEARIGAGIRKAYHQS